MGIYTKLGDVCDGELDIIYSKKINTASFLIKAAEYKNLHDTYMKKWGAICPQFVYYRGKPTGLDCCNGKPILLYNNQGIPK